MSGTDGCPAHLLKHVGDTDGALWCGGASDSWLGSDLVGEHVVVLLLLLLLLLLVGAGDEMGGE